MQIQEPRDGASGASQRNRRERRAPRPMTRPRLERIALHHIERFPSSAENLRRVLERRAARSREVHAGDPTEHSEWISAVVTRLIELGLLDDRAYAAAVARRLRTRGSSRRLIAARLAEKGVSDEIRRDVLDADADDPLAERRAAATYARRRGLGPHRPDPTVRRERRQRDLAALARAGFTYDVARQVLDRDPTEDR